jgi:hypothetical protein
LCLKGAGGFLAPLQFWWALEWPKEIVTRAYLPRKDKHQISINLLEYAALIIGLAGCIFFYESLPVETRPTHPMILLWTDNSTAKSWTKKISGLRTPQGHSLARVFAHLLMFSDVGIEAQHIAGEENVIADYLPRTKILMICLPFHLQNFRHSFLG